jgi:hypothetical protein
MSARHTPPYWFGSESCGAAHTGRLADRYPWRMAGSRGRLSPWARGIRCSARVRAELRRGREGLAAGRRHVPENGTLLGASHSRATFVMRGNGCLPLQRRLK